MSFAKVDGWLARLLPRRCILCGEPGGELNVCAACRRDMPWIREPCARCGAPLPPRLRASQCAGCTAQVEHIDRVCSALLYEYPVDRLIALTKFSSRTDCANVLGELLGVYLCEPERPGFRDSPEMILPVPLHRRRLARRGFNQASEIARPVAASLGVPVRNGICRRARNTPEQAGLSGTVRYRNMKDAFEIVGDVSGCHVAIVDDVVTTGSTMQAMAAGLRRAGASRIQVWSVARAVLGRRPAGRV